MLRGSQEQGVYIGRSHPESVSVCVCVCASVWEGCKNRRFFVLEKKSLGHFIFSSVRCQKGQRSNVRVNEEFRAACRQIGFQGRGRVGNSPRAIGASICVSFSEQLLFKTSPNCPLGLRLYEVSLKVAHIFSRQEHFCLRTHDFPITTDPHVTRRTLLKQQK